MLTRSNLERNISSFGNVSSKLYEAETLGSLILNFSKSYHTPAGFSSITHAFLPIAAVFVTPD